MTSSLQIKKDYYYVVIFYRNKAGKRCGKWVSTHLPVRNNKNRAKEMIPEIMDRYAYLEEAEIGSECGFSDYALDWLNRKKNTIEQSTFEKYENVITKHIEPFFTKKKLKIGEITPRHIVDYYDEKVRNGRLDGKDGGLCFGTLKTHSALIKEMLNSALIDGIIKSNPAAKVPLPLKEDKQNNRYVFLNQAQANDVITAFDGHNLQPVVFLTLYYGLRRSEVLGLKWNAIDFENDTMKIQHTVVKNRTIVAKDRTKSQTSRRTYELLGEAKKMLLKLKAEQDSNRKLFGNTYMDSDYVFAWEDGHTFRPDYVTRGFQRVLKSHGLTKMRFHDLRHSTCSILYDMGWDLKRIQEWVGHADIETTCNIYTHIGNDRKKAMAKEIDGIFTLKMA